MVGCCLRAQLTDGRRRLGYVIGATSSTLSGPCHISQWASTFNRKLVRGSLGGGVDALSERVDRVSFLKDFSGPLAGRVPGMAALEECGGLRTHLKTKKMIAEIF